MTHVQKREDTMGRNDHNATVGFVGLGTMGREMALNLLKAGFAVCAYDVRKEAIDDLVAQGATGAQSPADAARDADIIISMLPDTPQVEEIVYGEGGLLSAPPRGRLLVDMSTISPVAVRRMHADLKAAGVAFLDAPVSGGPVGAKNASLSIMAGGDKDAFLRAEPYFRAMGTTITHVGEAGAGQTVKLCNQLVCAINLQAICEALALGRASGVDLDQLRNVLLGGSAASWMLDKLGPAMIAGDASRRLPHRPDAQGLASRAGAGALTLRPAARNGAGDQPVCRGARSRRRHERQSGSFPGLRPNDEPGCDLAPDHLR